MSEIQYKYRFRGSTEHPHVLWMELDADGMLHECAVIKEDRMGNRYFIRINQLDDIDRRRLASLLHNRSAAHLPLWDVMSGVTLGNGVNALQYFHQLVKVLTPDGKQVSMGTGAVGVSAAGFQQI